MKNKLFLGQDAYTWLQGDDKKMNVLKAVLKDKKTVIVDDTEEYDSFKSSLPKNVTIVKNQAEADEILKKD